MLLRKGLLASVSILAFSGVAQAGPEGSSVVAGAANVSLPSSSLTIVNQTTQNAIIDWRSFSIGAGDATNFIVPTGGATLNRVTGADPSSIYGSLTSNGMLILANPNGIVVGPSGVIDTAGLILTTYAPSEVEFLARGAMTFSGSSGASVVNNGTIRSTGGGDVFLIARDVQNAGSISAPGGSVGLAAGSEIIVSATDAGDGRIAVRAGSGRVVNSGTIEAVSAELRAAGGNHYALAVNNTGVVRATGVSTRGGRVFLSANSGSISSSGKVSARNADGSGGRVRASTAGRPAGLARPRPAEQRNVVDITGSVDVASADGLGGSIVLEGEAISIGSAASLDASGATGGGRIVIGGGFRGQDATVVNADEVNVAAGAQIVADAKAKGDGGEVSIWADGATTFHGAISARGGALGGNGGFAEVSGKDSVAVSGHVDLRAPVGAAGTFLIDPGSILIQDGADVEVDPNTFNDAWIESQLGMANVVVATSMGVNGATPDITIQGGVSIVWNGNTRLTLRAGNDILVENNVVISNTQTGDGSTTNVQKDVSGVEFLAARNITVGSATGPAGAIRIGSEFGVTRLVAGDADFDGKVDVAGTGTITLSGGAGNGSSVQIGYQQTARRGNNTGDDYSSSGIHAENGSIEVLAGGDISLRGGSQVTVTDKGSFVQIGHGGVATTDTAEILGAAVTVESTGGSVLLTSQGVESAYAKIGNGSYLEARTVDSIYRLGKISGAIHVSALTSVALNGAATPAAATVAQDGNADIFLARIGHGAHVEADLGSAEIVTGDMAGSIIIDGPASMEPLRNVSLGFNLTPGQNDDGREVFSQIGHGTDLRIRSATSAGGNVFASLGAVRSFLDLNGMATEKPDIYVNADGIALTAGLSSDLNTKSLIQRASIGSGNYVRLQAGGINTNAPMNISAMEGDLTGNISVSATATSGPSVTLSSTVASGSTAASGDVALTRIGHGGFIQISTANGVDGSVGTAAPRHGGDITFDEANVLNSAISVTTQSGSDVSVLASVTAGEASAEDNVLGAAIGSGNEVFFVTGAGGKGYGNAGADAEAGARGGDILYKRGTVWDSGDVATGASTLSVGTGFDTTISVMSERGIKLSTRASAGNAQSTKNIVLGRIGHGALISMRSGAGGDAGTGSDGGRGGDIRVVQQTPARDYTVAGAADDFAWGLRGQIDLQASDLSSPALTIQSLAAAAMAAASSNTVSSRVGHGDQIFALSGNGGAGAARAADTFVSTAHGGRGGHIDIDLSRRLIESDIRATITGAVLVSAVTTNATGGSTKNLSEASIGHGESIQALSGDGGAGGSGLYLTNSLSVADSKLAAEEFFAFDVFGTESGAGAARGGNGGDVSIKLGAITERRDVGSGFNHNGDSNVILTITGSTPPFRSLTVSAAIGGGVANGPGDSVVANIGHDTRILALAGMGAAGGNGSASFDRGRLTGEALDPTTGQPVQNDASGGRGGDISIVAGAHDHSSAPAGSSGPDANTLAIGRVIVTADEQVRVTSSAGAGSSSRAEAGIGNRNDIVAATRTGGVGGTLTGTNGIDSKSGANDGIVNSALPIQIIVNRDGSRGVSLAGNGVADTIQSVAARRTATPVDGSTANPSFFDVSGNPEFILDGNGTLVANDVSNAALRTSAANIARFGRTVGAYDPGITNLRRVQYVDINNDGRPDVVAGVLTTGGAALTVVDADNDHVYDQISGRVRLADGDLSALGLIDYVYATNRKPAVVSNMLGWTYADFSTSNGGRGGDVQISTGALRNYDAADALVALNAGVANLGGSSSSANSSLIVSATMLADSSKAGGSNFASARIGATDYLHAVSDASENSRLAGALHASAMAGATGGGGGVNAVNANGGRGGDASVSAGAILGKISINEAAPETRGVLIESLTEDVLINNLSVASIGFGGDFSASSGNSGGAGVSDSHNTTITESADGGRGGNGSIAIAARSGDVNIFAGSAGYLGDYGLVIQALKSSSTSVADSNNITVANVGHGAFARTLGGAGGAGDDGQYQANGGAGGAASINIAAVSGAILLVTSSYADADLGNGVRIEASTSEGSSQYVSAQAGHFAWLEAQGGAGGSGTPQSEIMEQFNQQANGGAGGAGAISHAGFAGGVTIAAGQALDGTDAIAIKSSDNTVNSGANNYLLAAAGHGAWSRAVGGDGGRSGQGDAYGLTIMADPAFHQGFDIAGADGATAPLDRNPIMFGTVRNGGAGGAASVNIGETAGDIVVLARDRNPAGGKDGILVMALAGDGANDGSTLFQNVAAVGHGHNASAKAGAGGKSIDAAGGGTVTSGDGGDGGAASVSFAAISGDVKLTNVMAGDANAMDSTLDLNIQILSAGQDATDSAAHIALARVGHRSDAEAFGGAGGNAAKPPPGQLYTATVSAQGGIGGAATITSAAITGDISIVAENSVILDARNTNTSDPTIVAAIGHNAAVRAATGGGGGFGGLSANFNDAAMLTALRRYVDLDQNYEALSVLEKQLVAPVLNYYRIAAVYSGPDSSASLPMGFVSRILAGPAAFVSGTPNAYPLARDNGGVSASDYSVPTVSSEERGSLIALAMASGHGGRAAINQGAISGYIDVEAIGAGAADAEHGVSITSLGIQNAGTQIAHVGHESEVIGITGGKGQNLWAGTNAEGIGGDGGNVTIAQATLMGAIGIFAGSDVAETGGDILVSASGTQTIGWQRSLVGHRAAVGSDDPGQRAAVVASGGDGGGDQDSIASGKLGNGGSVSIAQAGIAGAITLLAQRASPSGTSISILSKATQASGEALVEIGHSALVASAQAGSAVPYLPVDTAVSLFGVREGNGGSIGISQGGVNGDILFDARDALKVDATTVLASGRATILTGHQQIVADNVYGARNGAVTAGAGAGSISVEDIDVATGAAGFTDTVHASPVQDADGGNVVISQADIAAGIILQSRNGNVDVLADGNTGETTTYVGHQRFTRATTGEGGTSGIAGERAPAEGGTALLTRGTVEGDILIQAMAANTTATVKTTSVLDSTAAVKVGQTVDFNITTGRSGYGADAYNALEMALGEFLALSTPTSGAGASNQATSRDQARVIQVIENVVAALTIANRYADQYGLAEKANLATALTDATAALSAARTASAHAVVAAAVISAQEALSAGLEAALYGRNSSAIADAADGGAIVYANDAAVSGDVTVRAGIPATSGGAYLAGVVAIQAEGGDGAGSFVELGHRHTIANTTGLGAGLTVGGSTDGGVAGDGGSISVSQSTSGDVSLVANRVVVNPTSGAGPASIHLLHNVSLANRAGKADIEEDLGRGGAIAASQTASGVANITANELSSSATGAADGLLAADGGTDASNLHIGILASALHLSGSDETIGLKGGADNNRGGTISATQTITSAFNLDLDLNNSGNLADVIIRAAEASGKYVAIGAIVTQNARSGDPVDDGSDVTVTQAVSGDLRMSGLEDLVVENKGPGASGVHLGHDVSLGADSGETAGETSQYGGVTRATQSVSGAIALTASRSFTQQTNAEIGGVNLIGHRAALVARSADQRVGAGSEDYPVVAGAASLTNFNVVASQTVQADLGVTAGEILIQSLNGVADGVRLGNVANILTDTHGGGRVSSTQTLGGAIGLTTVAAAAQQADIVTTAVVGDIRVLVPSKAGSAQVGHASTSTVSHDPATYQPTGVFVTKQDIVSSIAVSALRNVELTEGGGGVTRIGHVITEMGALSTTDAVKTSAADPSTVEQSVTGDISVTAGNGLAVATTSGTAQIGHYSPTSNEWQVTGGRVVTPQSLAGDITVKVGLNSTATVTGEAPSLGALGTNNALLDGSSGGTVRIGHQFAPADGDAANQVQTASGDIWLEVGAHLHVLSATVGHGPYDYTSTAISTMNAVMGEGSVRNRIAGLTTIGALQNSSAPEDASTEADALFLYAAAVNSGYGDNGGQLRFFIPSRQNLSIVIASLFNDSDSNVDAIPARMASTDIIEGAVTHENYFATMSTSARYLDIGPGNYAFYFGSQDMRVDVPYVETPLDGTHRFEGFSGSCTTGVGGGVNSGGAGSRRKGALAQASSFGLTSDGSSNCAQGGGAAGGQAAGGQAAGPRRNTAFTPADAASASVVQPGASLSASPTIVIAEPSAPAASPVVSIPAIQLARGGILTFAMSGTTLTGVVRP